MKIRDPIAIFDLDGTLALVDHRRHFVTTKPRNFAAFDAACVDDDPNWPVVETLLALASAGFEIWIVSGRRATVRVQTEAWLRTHGIRHARLLMRPKDDYTADESLKRSWLSSNGGIIPLERVRMVFDDREPVVAMWRLEGLSCFQVANTGSG